MHEHTSIKPTSRRLFTLVRLIRLTNERDEVLDLPIVEPYGSDMLLGLPAISPKKLYIVDVGDVDECLVLVDWEVQFLWDFTVGASFCVITWRWSWLYVWFTTWVLASIVE